MAEEKKVRNWLIEVNATKSNILGNARKFEKQIPWHITDGNIGTGDTVFFYLTQSAKDEDVTESQINDLYKRFLFEGIVIETNTVEKLKEKSKTEKIYDDDFWTDEEKEAKVKRTTQKYAIIEITKNLYDYKIHSDVIPTQVWQKNFNKEVFELELETVENIRSKIK